MGMSRGAWASAALVATLLCCLCAASPVAHAQTVTYGYDAWGRVTSATYANGLTTAYVYDPAGNRTEVSTAATPFANPVSVVVGADSVANPVTLDVAGSYSSAAVATAAVHGVASASGKTITYTPNTGYSGLDAFTYTVANAAGVSAPAPVEVIVAPVAQNVSATVAYQSADNPMPLHVLGAYSSVALFTFPGHGVATPSGTQITYTPNAGYSGGDSFEYTASNAVSTSGPATVTVTVNPEPPIANDVTASVVHNSSDNPIELDITGGEATSVAVSTQAAHGAATASGVHIAYTPEPGYVGADSFAYTASNAGGTSSPATAHITVTGLQAVATAPFNCPNGEETKTYVCAAGSVAAHAFTDQPSSVVVTGGSGHYTYAWTVENLDEGEWTATGVATAVMTPTVSKVPIENSGTAEWSCLVTDTDTGMTATTNFILYYYYRN